MAYGFNDDKSKVEVVANYPSSMKTNGYNLTLSSNEFREGLTKTVKDGFFFVTFTKLPQGATGTVDVYLDSIGHRIANVSLSEYAEATTGFVPIKKGHKLCFKFYCTQSTATVHALIYEVH